MQNYTTVYFVFKRRSGFISGNIYEDLNNPQKATSGLPQNNVDQFAGSFGLWLRCSLVIPTVAATDMRLASASPTPKESGQAAKSPARLGQRYFAATLSSGY
jgi:hypothetical protein